MIRIDEIYQNIIWPYIVKHRPGTRLFYCDPPGSTDPSSLLNYGRDDVEENNYIFLHDQEPIHTDLHYDLFKQVENLNGDIWPLHEPRPQGHVIVSEKGEYVKWLEDTLNWHSYYYFYHGWAAQDWYRGYDKTYLIPRAKDRSPRATFINPNRIIGGKRDHRVLLLYYIFRNQLHHTNYISAPKFCPYEQVSIDTIANKFVKHIPDIVDVFNSVDLPIHFKGEDRPIMSSYMLTNFDESADSLFYIVTETVYSGNRLHLTEKTFKPIALEMPFVLVAPAGSLEYLRSYGFKTFGDVIDESYDTEIDDLERIRKIGQLVTDLNNLSVRERSHIHKACLAAVEHNWNHFYSGTFANLLWVELTEMLKQFAYD